MVGKDVGLFEGGSISTNLTSMNVALDRYVRTPILRLPFGNNCGAD